MILCINTSISSQEGWNEPDEYNYTEVNSRDSYFSPYQSKIVLLIFSLIHLRVNLVLKNHSFYFQINNLCTYQQNLQCTKQHTQKGPSSPLSCPTQFLSKEETIVFLSVNLEIFYVFMHLCMYIHIFSLHSLPHHFLVTLSLFSLNSVSQRYFIPILCIEVPYLFKQLKIVFCYYKIKYNKYRN